MRRAMGTLLGGENENYSTPAWVTKLLMEADVLPSGAGQRWLEPACGDGAIIREVDAWPMRPASWRAVDIRTGLTNPSALMVDLNQGTDFLGTDAHGFVETGEIYDVGITNPAFSLAEPYLERMRALCTTVSLLLPLPWWGSAERDELFRRHTPDMILVVPDRIQFVDPTIKTPCMACKGTGEYGLLGCNVCNGKGFYKASSPAADMAWWIWRAGRATHTITRRLRTTPQAERAWWKAAKPVEPMYVEEELS